MQFGLTFQKMSTPVRLNKSHAVDYQQHLLNPFLSSHPRTLLTPICHAQHQDAQVWLKTRLPLSTKTPQQLHPQKLSKILYLKALLRVQWKEILADGFHDMNSNYLLNLVGFRIIVTLFVLIKFSFKVGLAGLDMEKVKHAGRAHPDMKEPTQPSCKLWGSFFAEWHFFGNHIPSNSSWCVQRKKAILEDDEGLCWVVYVFQEIQTHSSGRKPNIG